MKKYSLSEPEIQYIFAHKKLKIKVENKEYICIFDQEKLKQLKKYFKRSKFYK